MPARFGDRGLGIGSRSGHHPTARPRSPLRAPQSIILLLLLGCGTSVGPTGALAPGQWGGVGANLLVTPDSVTVTFDCAGGWIDVLPVPLDAAGRFAVAGRFQSRIGAVLPPVPARYTGAVSAGGASVTLSVTVSPAGVTLGPYQLLKDQVQELQQCR
jgi:hypothetical protein